MRARTERKPLISLERNPDVPKPVRGARESYAIEGTILEMPNISRLSRF
jgi:hypothetical protein